MSVKNHTQTGRRALHSHAKSARSQLRILTMSDAWHWTSKDVTQITKAALSVALEAPPLLSAASPLLHGCRLSSIRMAGDCSVHARKGRRFLLYELKLECVWRGGKDGAEASGSLQLPDLSPECLDDLAIEFTTDCPGTPLSEAMRKLGVPAIRRAVQSCIRTLELKVAEADATPKVALPSAGPSVSSSASGTGGAAPGPGTGESATDQSGPVRDAALVPLAPANGPGPARGAPPLPKLANADAGVAAVIAAVAAAQSPPPAAEAPAPASWLTSLPIVVRLMLQKVRASPKGHVTAVRLAAVGLQDHHLQPIIELLHASDNSIETLDLSYNELTDEGASALFDALEQGSAKDTGASSVSYIHLGGNVNITATSRKRAAELVRNRGDVSIDWRPILDGAKPCCNVGMVYKNSPAAKAGLVKGDAILQWVMLQKGRTLAQRFGFQPSMQDGLGEAFLAGCEYMDVATSISPLVRQTIGMPHDIVVRRKAESGEEHVEGYVCHKLRLTPERWSGQGLLGCVLK